MILSSEELARALEWLLAEVQASPELAGELAESRRSFFGHRSLPGGVSEELPQRRHLEWFLIERHSPHLGGAPIEVIVNSRPRGGVLGRRERDRSLDAPLAALLSSLASVFEVTGVAPGEGVWARDLAGGGEYALREPEAAAALLVSDLLVGRIFEVGDHLHQLSGAAGLFRDERLMAAVRADLERARASRRGTLRLSQAELEKMFWGDPLDANPAATREELRAALARARAVLAAGGLDDEDCSAIFEGLRSMQHQALGLLPGGGDVLGNILERLAIESSVDLAAARVALLEVWAGYARAAGPSLEAGAGGQVAARGRMDPRAAMQAFDEGRAEGRDLEQLFVELERDLGLDVEDDGDVEDLAPDFPGVVAAMVEEYLWELESRGEAGVARAHACLRKFGEFGASIGVFENLGRRDLLLFASIWLPELGQLESPREARELLDALEAFCSWCEDQHALPLRAEFDAEVAALRESLPRLVAARPYFETGVGQEAGDPYEVRAVEGRSLVLGDAAGRELRAEVRPELTQHLRAGDWLRAEASAKGSLRVFCGYPPQSARLRPR